MTPVAPPFSRQRNYPFVAGRGNVFLYLARFDDIAKVGVTRWLHCRVSSLRREAAGIQSLYFAAIPEARARDLERMIAQRFGRPTKTRGRMSEWFDVARFDESLALLRDPDCHAPTWRDRRRERSAKRYRNHPAHLIHGASA